MRRNFEDEHDNVEEEHVKSFNCLEDYSGGPMKFKDNHDGKNYVFNSDERVALAFYQIKYKTRKRKHLRAPLANFSKKINVTTTAKGNNFSTKMNVTIPPKARKVKLDFCFK